MRYMLLFCALWPLLGTAQVIDQLQKVPPSTASRYELIDLGETDVPLAQLSKYALPLSMAPQINDNRQVSCNQERQVLIKEIPYREMAPQISRMASVCYGINNSGDMLLAFARSPSDIIWQIWTQRNLRVSGRAALDLGDLLGRNVYFRQINDLGMAVGIFKPAGSWRPIVYTKELGLHHLGYYLGWDITGIAWGVNNRGTVVGVIDELGERIPYAWNRGWGLERLNGLKYQLECLKCRQMEGAIAFADLIIGDNDLIYGTFTIKADVDTPKDSAEEYHAFWWDPRSHEVRVLPLGGMRLNGIFADGQTLIGSLSGEAALCDIGCQPHLLSALVSDTARGWKLLEATDSNSHGDIVGYGLSEGKCHYFMLKCCSRRG